MVSCYILCFEYFYVKFYYCSVGIFKWNFLGRSAEAVRYRYGIVFPHHLLALLTRQIVLGRTPVRHISGPQMSKKERIKTKTIAQQRNATLPFFNSLEIQLAQEENALFCKKNKNNAGCFFSSPKIGVM